MKYLKVEADLAKLLEPLSDSEIGRLFNGLIEYLETEKEPALIGNEKYLWNIAKQKTKFHRYSGPKGENHWNWKGGITPKNQVQRKSAEYNHWRDAIFMRDNYTCQKCGKYGGTLNAHHIAPWAYCPSMRFNVGNGITLCSKCHKEVHHGA